MNAAVNSILSLSGGEFEYPYWRKARAEWVNIDDEVDRLILFLDKPGKGPESRLFDRAMLEPLQMNNHSSNALGWQRPSCGG